MTPSVETTIILAAFPSPVYFANLWNWTLFESNLLHADPDSGRENYHDDSDYDEFHIPDRFDRGK